MSYLNKQSATNLSNVLILGLALEKLPLSVIQPFLNKAMSVMHTKHPALFERVESTNYDYIINACDLPFFFYLNPSKKTPILKAFRSTEHIHTSAVITGSLENLLRIFEGNSDGDADFFSGNLIIEGNTAAVVHLRNAIDSEEMDIINDLSDIFPFYKKIFVRAFNKINKINHSWQNKLDIISSAITGPIDNKMKDQKIIIEEILTEIDILKKEHRKYKKEDIRKKSDYNSSI